MKLSNEKLVNKAFYDKMSVEWVKRFFGVYHQDEFNKYKQLLLNGKVLDIGCGAGRDAGLFLSDGYDYTGIDLSDGMLEEARKIYPNANFRKMDLASLEFDDESFDGVWSIATYLHVPKSEIDEALSEMNRVLKMDGKVYIKIKKGSFEAYLGEGNEKRYFAFYGSKQFAKLLEKAGFEILDFWEDKRSYNPPDVSVFLCYLAKKVKSPLEI